MASLIVSAGRRARAVVLLLAVLCSVPLRAMEIPSSELAQPPSARRIAALQAAAAREGWGPLAVQLRTAALGLYARQAPTAQAWYYLYRWADLFRLTETEALSNWIGALKEAGAVHANLPRQFRTSQQPLADFWPPALQAYALSSPDFSDQFFTLLSPLDEPAAVSRILAAIWTHQPETFKTYANLAVAIAMVYDEPPPPDWPHGQVSPQALPRRLLPPVEVFDFFVHADQTGATLEHLRRLLAADLKYVVDIGADFADLTWAQTHIQIPLSALAKAYDLVRYRRDRLASGTLTWPQATYRLPDILQAGGICVDQAYFAAMVGKAKGVPTLLFRGAGLDGRHAWFGFLDGDGHWHLDCGRYADQQYVAGFAFDPQTWTNISDHELMFLSEGFRRLPLFKSSWMHTQFAQLYFQLGDFAAAAKAARLAVDIERRNFDAWTILITAERRQGVDPRQIEGLLQEGALAFQRYPDLEIQFKTLLSQSLRVRGDTSLADQIERSTMQKYEGRREDLSVQQAQEILQRSLDHDDLNNRIRTYYKILNLYGRGAGTDFFDQIVRPFVEHLLSNDQPQEAVHAVEQARRTLRVAPNTQLEQDFNALAARARNAAS